MRVFDRTDARNLDLRETHLWGLTLGTLFALIVAVALLLYPAVYLQPVVLSGGALSKLFVGFCVLAGLLFGYLIDRHALIAHLRRKVAEQQTSIMEIRRQASAELLESLPGFSQLRDQLAMEFRRASSMYQPLSLLVVVVEPNGHLAETSEATAAMGDAAKALVRKLRGEDSIYVLGSCALSVLLPAANAEAADAVSNRLTEGLQDAAGASSRFTFQIHVFNYPLHAQSAREIEAAVRPYVDKTGLSESEVTLLATG
jgi:GGDEF domain-containing protein